MINALKYSSWFLLLVLLQGLVFNNVLFWGYLNPYLYVLFILILPVNTDKALLLVACFALGACMDMFENSGGIHAAACTFIGFIRPIVLRILSRRQGAELNELRLKDLGLPTTAVYSIILIFLHHLLLFGLEAFKLSEIGLVMLRAIYSSLFTFALVMMVQLWRYRSS
jgi:rod shape-determining protein MreD